MAKQQKKHKRSNASVAEQDGLLRASLDTKLGELREAQRQVTAVRASCRSLYKSKTWTLPRLSQFIKSVSRSVGIEG